MRSLHQVRLSFSKEGPSGRKEAHNTGLGKMHGSSEKGAEVSGLMASVWNPAMLIIFLTVYPQIGAMQKIIAWFSLSP